MMDGEVPAADADAASCCLPPPLCPAASTLPSLADVRLGEAGGGSSRRGTRRRLKVPGGLPMPVGRVRADGKARVTVVILVAASLRSSSHCSSRPSVCVYLARPASPVRRRHGSQPLALSPDDGLLSGEVRATLGASSSPLPLNKVHSCPSRPIPTPPPSLPRLIYSILHPRSPQGAGALAKTARPLTPGALYSSLFQQTHPFYSRHIGRKSGTHYYYMKTLLLTCTKLRSRLYQKFYRDPLPVRHKQPPWRTS